MYKLYNTSVGEYCDKGRIEPTPENEEDLYYQPPEIDLLMPRKLFPSSVAAIQNPHR